MLFTMPRLMEERGCLQYTKQTLCRKLMVFFSRFSEFNCQYEYMTVLCRSHLLGMYIYFQCCREVAEKYPEIKYEEVVIDNCCMMVQIKFYELLILCMLGH